MAWVAVLLLVGCAGGDDSEEAPSARDVTEATTGGTVDLSARTTHDR